MLMISDQLALDLENLLRYLLGDARAETPYDTDQKAMLAELEEAKRGYPRGSPAHK